MYSTAHNNLINIEKLSWEITSTLLEPLLPEVVKTINLLPSNLRYPFYKARYRFGDTIIDKNGVYLSVDDGSNISLNDSNLPESLIKGLSYNPKHSNPIGIILNKNCEFYRQDANRVIPHAVLQPGDVFGFSHSPSSDNIYTHFLWDMVAGSKSMFMLAKVADNPSHSHLQKAYNLTSLAPKNYLEQWEVFKEIAYNANSSWQAEILFLDNQWLELLKDPSHSNLLAQFSQAGNNGNKIWHHMPSWESDFGKIECDRHLNTYSSNVLDTAKHIFTMAAGCVSGFSPAEDEQSAPIKLLQHAYREYYQLEHMPIIMEPTLFSPEDGQPIYYSLNYPTLPQYSPPKTASVTKSVISHLILLKQILATYQSSIQKGRSLRAVSLKEAASTVNFSYYHDNPHGHQGIKHVSLIPDEDSRFVNTRKSKFPVHSSFLIGLIKIGPKIESISTARSIPKFDTLKLTIYILQWIWRFNFICGSQHLKRKS